jgi:hypothetical protein
MAGNMLEEVFSRAVERFAKQRVSGLNSGK